MLDLVFSVALNMQRVATHEVLMSCLTTLFLLLISELAALTCPVSAFFAALLAMTHEPESAPIVAVPALIRWPCLCCSEALLFARHGSLSVAQGDSQIISWCCPSTLRCSPRKFTIDLGQDLFTKTREGFCDATDV